MEFMKLDANNQPSTMIEGYDSLIWTERFNNGLGEFQMTVGDASKFMTLLPKGTIVTLRDSTVPMIVETHNPVRKKNQPEVTTIKGRSFESILDRRASMRGLIAGSADWSVVAKIPSDAAYYAIDRVCVAGVASAADKFPTSMVQFSPPADYLAASGPNRSYSIPRGNLLTTVLQFLQTSSKADATTIPPTPEVVEHGIKSTRPDANGTAIGITIYTGTDRSGTVYFDGTRDLLDDGSYLFSDVGSATTAYVIGATTAVSVEKSGTIPTGMNRRVILVDGSAAGVSNEASLVESAKVSLSEASVTAMFDGSINAELSPYVYGVDYFLGDVVKLVGDYGLEQKARVTEYIRSEDKNGVKSYPTLSTIE